MNEQTAPTRRSYPGDVQADLAALSEERDFLLSSLRDLEAEHDAQDIDDVDYETLRDDYTARTAEVLRAIERAKQPASRVGRRRVSSPSSEAARSAPSPGDAGAEPAGVGAEAAGAGARKTKTRWRLVAILSSLLLFGVIAGWLVTSMSGSRVAGQSITGNSNLRNPTPAPSPSAVDSNLNKAATMVSKGKIGDALKLYDQILQTTPGQPEAEANSGWLIAQTGLAVTPNRMDLIDAGLTRIVAAEKAAPTYADPHFFRGFVLLNGKHDPGDAVTELRIYLATVDPTSPSVPEVEAVLKQAIAAAGPNVPAGPFAAKAPTTTKPPTVTPTTAAP